MFFQSFARCHTPAFVGRVSVGRRENSDGACKMYPQFPPRGLGFCGVTSSEKKRAASLRLPSGARGWICFGPPSAFVQHGSPRSGSGRSSAKPCGMGWQSRRDFQLNVGGVIHLRCFAGHHTLFLRLVTRDNTAPLSSPR